jgi:endonuclease/exonuclease/phosphatase (EEP) superfamily protein YafD
MKNFLSKSLLFFTLISAFVYLVGFAGYFHWIPDLFTHFRMYHLGGLVILLIGGILIKQKSTIWLNIILTFLIIIPLFKFYMPSIKSSENGLKIGAINLLSSNRAISKVIHDIQIKNYDIIIFQEVSPFWGNALGQINAQYPYHKSVIREGNFGMAIYSKLPLQNIKVLSLCRTGIPTITCESEWKGKKLNIIGIHPEPPDDQDGFENRNILFEKVNQIVKSNQEPSIVLGDFNCTANSSNLRRLTEGSGLKDSRRGFGLQNTWNNDWPFVSITLDHAFATKEISILSRSVGPENGSDHLPLFLEIDI